MEAQKPPQLEIPKRVDVDTRPASQGYSARVPRKLARMPRGGRLKEVGLTTPKPLTPPATDSSSSDAASSSSRRSATLSTDADASIAAPIQQGPAALPNFRTVQNLSLAEETSPYQMGKYVSQVSVDPRYNAEEEVKTAGKWRVGRERVYLITAVIAVKLVSGTYELEPLR